MNKEIGIRNREIKHTDYLGNELEYGDVVLMTEMSNNGFILGIIVGSTPKKVRVITKYDWNLDENLKGNCKDPQYIIKHPSIPNQDIELIAFNNPKNIKDYLEDLEKYGKEH